MSFWIQKKGKLYSITISLFLILMILGGVTMKFASCIQKNKKAELNATEKK